MNNWVLLLNMTLSFISSIAWQLVAIAVIFILYDKLDVIKSLFLKHNNTEVKLEFSGEERGNVVSSSLKKSQSEKNINIQYQDSSKSFQWRKYSNGFLVVQFQIKLSKYINIESQIVYYPLSMPNEIISMQLITPLNLKITRLEKYSCEVKSLSYIEKKDSEQMIEVIICGF